MERKPVWISEASCVEETSSGSEERVGRGCPYGGAPRREESEHEPREESAQVCVEERGQCETPEPECMSGEWDAKSNGNLVTYRGTKQIKYIKNILRDQIGIGRKGRYKHRIGGKVE